MPVCRLGDLALCKEDKHGCPGCPHVVIGPAIGGSPDVSVEGRPVLRMGDPGIHAACCALNIWKAVDGSSGVFVNGKPVVRVQDRTRHCASSVGEMLTGSPTVSVGGGNYADACPAGPVLDWTPDTVLVLDDQGNVIGFVSPLPGAVGYYDINGNRIAYKEQGIEEVGDLTDLILLLTPVGAEGALAKLGARIARILERQGGRAAVKAMRAVLARSLPSGFAEKLASRAAILSEQQEANLGRFIKKLPRGAKNVQKEKLSGGRWAFSADVPGRVPGSNAVYRKVVDASGKTVEYTKTTTDPAGRVVHVKDKLHPGRS